MWDILARYLNSFDRNETTSLSICPIIDILSYLYLCDRDVFVYVTSIEDLVKWSAESEELLRVLSGDYNSKRVVVTVRFSHGR